MNRPEKQRLPIITAAVIAAFSAEIYALPFNSMDPRALAMGGTGVASANVMSATAYNPAMLALPQEQGSYGISFPYFGVSGYGFQDFIDFEDADYVDKLDQAINAIPNDPDPTDTMLPGQYRDVANRARELNGGLIDISDTPFGLDLGGGAVFGRADRQLGMAISLGATGSLAGGIYYRDAAVLDKLADDVDSFATCLADAQATYAGGSEVIPASCYASLNYIDATGQVTFDSDQDLDSSVAVTGLVMSEVALSFATERMIEGQSVLFGVTPKIVKTTVIEYSETVNDSDSGDATDDDYTADYSDFNLDLGASYMPAPGWRAGFVIKNLIGQTYEFERFGVKSGRSIDVKPMARAGIAFQSDWYLLAADIDLTANAAAGLGDDSRQIALGAEFIPIDWAKLRVGYRADVGNSDRSVATVGFGLFNAVDLAVAVGSDEIGGALRFGYQF
ncbi:MAG: conjugal transfer protein TraF [Gammaproteobacteria bacterium]|nr:conjugal transfer protein TraF [Gammaproteobacteria bacterium]